MSTRRRIVSSWIVLSALHVVAGAQVTTRVSVGPGGVEANGPSLGPGAIALGGRYVTFTSNASNLVPGDTNFHADAMVHDLVTGTTTCASVSSAGVIGNDSSTDPRISGDGRYVAYISTATNLVVGDTNGRDDVFVHDQVSGTTTRINIGALGQQANNESVFATISADGRYVSYVSSATNIVGGDTNGFDDVFLHDLGSGTTLRVSQGMSLTQPDADCFGQSLSADGRTVAYWSSATNIVPGDTNGVEDAFVYDLITAVTTRVSVDSAGAQANARSQHPTLSADGRWVVFWSQASNLVAGDTNGAIDVFVHDRQTGATERVSVDSSGVQGNGASSPFKYQSISSDGTRIVFSSQATNLVLGDTNGWNDVFVRDRSNGTTTRVSVSSTGVQGNGQSSPVLPPTISGDGGTVAFDSGSGNFVVGDTNGQYDIFVHTLALPYVAYCAGDGSATACPCSNAGLPQHGCPSSLYVGGALLSVTGSASVSNDTIVLAGSSMPNAAALYFQGTTRTSGGLGAQFGDGLRCASGFIVRLATKQNASGSSSFGGPVGDVPVSVRGMVPAGGGVRVYQVWYRNSAAFCTSSTFNLSNGVELSWAP